MMKPILKGLLTVALLYTQYTVAQTPSRQAAVLVSATVSSYPASVQLSWPSHPGATSYTVFRRNPSALPWNSAIATLSGTAQSYTDLNIQAGVVYEYKVVRQGNGQGYGYLKSGVHVSADQMHTRGKIILLVESGLATQINPELATLENDLLGDGWYPIRVLVSANDTPSNVKTQVETIYSTDPTNIKAVYIIGHVPVPYTGIIAPDGHSSHAGAWPSDGYYGEMYSSWPDAYASTTSAATPANHNVPGDGKFDQSDYGSEVELMVGRVYLGELPAFSQSEVQLTKNYLNKAHAFKIAQWAPPNTAAVLDHLSFLGVPIAATGYLAGAALVGHQNVQDLVQGSQASANINTNKYLISYRSGHGTQDTYQGNLTYVGINNLNTTYDVAAHGNGSVFNMSFGSYFGDWDNYNNYLRALLAKGDGLTSVWSGQPNFYFHQMGMGEPIGTSVRASMNNTNSNYTRQNGGWQGQTMSRVHLALMGDPTLRMRMVAPATNLTAISSGYNMSFTWAPSPENVQGYYLYRVNDSNGQVELISPLVSGNSYTAQNVAFVPGQRFLVRASQIRTTASGSYEDLSIGAVATASGTPVVDCAGVLGGVSIPGAPCNDGDPSTGNDIYDSNCTCLGTVTGITSACFTLGGSGDPDVEESDNGGIYMNAGSLDLVFDSELPWNWRGDQRVGLHFNSVNIPSGALLVSAHIQFTANGTTAYGPCELNIAAEAIDNSPEISFNVNDISARGLTQNSVLWAPPGWTTIDEASNAQRTPNLSAVLQEIVNGGGWNDGNAITVVITGTGGRQAWSWNDDPSKAAVLCVTYQGGGAVQPDDCAGTAGGNALPGTPCDDGDPNTQNDIYASDCSCSGTPVQNNGDMQVCVNLGTSADPDAEEAMNGGMYANAGAFDLVYDSELPWNWRGDQLGGLYFEQVGIPQGASIQSAYIQFTAQGTENYNPIQLNIAAEASAEPSPFGYQVNDLSSRLLTNAQVQWSPSNWNIVNESGNAQRSPDLKSVIQELVDDNSWQINRNMVFVISGSGGRQAYSHDQDPGKAAKLCITYSTTTTSLPPDCLGIPGGSAVLDDCGVCNGNNACQGTNNSECFTLDPSGDDDREEASNGGIYSSAGALDLVFDSELPWNWRGNQTIGLRYTNMNIPRGAIITDANILFTVFDTVNYNPCQIGITAEASDHAAPLGWGPNDISSRPTTNAIIGWNPADWLVMNNAGGSQTSPNLSSMIQEVVDRQGWNNGNAMCFIIGGTGGRQAYSSDQDPNAAPKLCVSWEVPSAQLGQRSIADHHIALDLYPNPNDGSGFNLHVDIQGRDQADEIDAHIVIYDLLGQKMLSMRAPLSLGNKHTWIPLEKELSQGVYLVMLEYGGNARSTKRLVIE